MRQYHCNPCDFHIYGPSDEVADEIDAHEEHHRTTETVDDIEVTPEILFAVSRWVFDTALPMNVAHALADAAATMRREQSDEKRIDELVQVFFQAGKTAEGDYNVRAGIQAVAAKLDEEREQPFNKGGPTVQPLRQWGDLRDVPNDVLAVRTTEGDLRRNGSESHDWRWTTGNSVSAYGLTAHAPYTEIPTIDDDERDQQDGPAQWLTLTEVPNHVQTVTDKNGAQAHRDESALHGWRWHDDSPISQWGSRAFGPYTEVTS